MTWRIGKRYKFAATKTNTNGRFFLLHNIQDVRTGTPFRDHVWLRKCKKFRKIAAEITFTAKVNEYVSKGERKLTLTNIRNLEEC